MISDILANLGVSLLRLPEKNLSNNILTQPYSKLHSHSQNDNFPPLARNTSAQNDPSDLFNITNLNEAISLLQEGLTKTNKPATIKIIKTAIQGFESFANNPPIITEIIYYL